MSGTIDNVQAIFPESPKEIEECDSCLHEDCNGTYEFEREFGTIGFNAVSGNSDCIFHGERNSRYKDSKINLNTHSAYIDTEGILRKCVKNSINTEE